MDLASIFYILGIAFFISGFIVMIAGGIAVYTAYRKFQSLKQQAPMQVISYLQSHNSQALKALGVTLVGFVMNMLKSRMQKKSA